MSLFQVLAESVFKAVKNVDAVDLAQGVGKLANKALDGDIITGTVIKRGIQLASGEDQVTSADRIIGTKLIDYYGDRDGRTEFEDVEEIGSDLIAQIGETVGEFVSFFGNILGDSDN